MGVPGSANPLLLVQQGSTQYTVARSLRFNSSDSAYLSRSVSSPGNLQTWTLSAWLKRSALGGTNGQYIFHGSPSGSNQTFIRFNTDNTLQFLVYLSSSTAGAITTSAVYRDLSAWLHLVAVLDTTNATASERMRLYVNGERITAFSSSTTIAQNTNGTVNSATAHEIGRNNPAISSDYLNGYLAECIFVDGSALTPSSFAETNATTGQWVPKAYTGSYGTNGFKLDFSDNSAATAAALGKDFSGNGNNFTPTNLSVTTGAGNDSLVDTPTSYGTDTGAGGEVRGNYCVWNQLANLGHTLTNGNLDASSSAISTVAGSTGMVSGKYYWEITLNTVSGNVSPTFGYINETFNIATTGASNYIGGGSNSGGIRRDNGQYIQNNTSTSMTGSAGFSAGDVAMLAFDADAKKMWVGKNGTWYNNGAPASGTGNVPFTITGNIFFPAINTYGDSWSVNFGQRPFAYTAPSGFKALCDTNLPTPVVAKPSTVFDTVLWTGNGSSKTISGLAFSPDLVWAKVRSTNYNHTLFDAVRGATQTLSSSMTVQEYTEPTGPTAFTSDGWSMSGDVTYVGSVNANNQTYVGWVWDAGSSNATNTQGSITSTVRANASAGFSIVTYTGNSLSSQSVGHGLGSKPHLIIVKPRNATSIWLVGHNSLGFSTTAYLALNSTAASTTYSGVWGGQEPTSNVFYVETAGTSNSSGITHVAYCWAPVAGYSSFGSYTGNGSTDGPFVFCNFRPRWVMFKRSDAADQWLVQDTARDPSNVAKQFLLPNSSGAEGTDTLLDITSSGFKLRTTTPTMNANGGTYVWAAFAESPFQYARAR